jgi:Serine carboxypeptidase S28
MTVEAFLIRSTDRYWGKSSPYEELTVKNLQHLTLANSIADTVYFAKNAYLPFDPTNCSNAQHVVSPSSKLWECSV